MTYIGLATSPAYEENQQSFSFREKSLWQDKLKSLAGDSDQLFYHSLIRKRDSKRRLHRCFEGTRDKCPDRHDRLGFYIHVWKIQIIFGTLFPPYPYLYMYV